MKMRLTEFLNLFRNNFIMKYLKNKQIIFSKEGTLENFMNNVLKKSFFFLYVLHLSLATKLPTYLDIYLIIHNNVKQLIHI